jgi:hypothetical protein
MDKNMVMELTNALTILMKEAGIMERKMENA